MQIAEVSSLDGEDSSEEAGSAYQEAADAAHALLLAMCTDPSHGLAGASAVEELDMDEGALGSGAGSNPAGEQGSSCTTSRPGCCSSTTFCNLHAALL